MKDPLSLNWYTYCEDDPVNGVDPSGHSPESYAIGDTMTAIAPEVTCIPVAGEIFDVATAAVDVYNGYQTVKSIVKCVKKSKKSKTKAKKKASGSKTKKKTTKSSVKDVTKVPNGWKNVDDLNAWLKKKGLEPGPKDNIIGNFYKIIYYNKEGKPVGEIHVNQEVNNCSGGKYYPKHFEYYRPGTDKVDYSTHYYGN